MGIDASAYSRPAKFSTIIADADLDIGARAILTSNFALYEFNATIFQLQNRAKTLARDLYVDELWAEKCKSDIFNERNTGSGVTIDGLQIKDDVIKEPGSLNEPQVYAKVASNNNRHAHSYDGNRAPDASAYAKVAGMVFTDGIVGTLRVETDISSSDDVSAFCEIKYVVNSVDKGIVKQSSLKHPLFDTVTQDIALDIEAGDELELWMRCINDVQTVYAKNWKIDYDNAADAIAVGQTEA